MKRIVFTCAALILASTPVWAKTAHPAAPPHVAPASVGSLEGHKQIQDVILKSLEDGNDQYRKERVPTLKRSGRWPKLLKGQTPKAMVLACSDARVVPEELFHAGPGELYVVRVSGPVVSPEVLASLEYGAETLKIPVLVVLGHQDCAAIRTAIAARLHPGDTRESDNRVALNERLFPACDQALNAGLKGENLEGAAARDNVKNTLRAALEGSPLLWQYVKKKASLRVVGALYSIHTGEVLWIP